jgi:ATP-dependent Zn protease
MDRLKLFMSSKQFIYGALSGIGLLYLKYAIYDNFKSITEAEQMIEDKQF